jgi:hypothetical protein
VIYDHRDAMNVNQLVCRKKELLKIANRLLTIREPFGDENILSCLFCLEGSQQGGNKSVIFPLEPFCKRSEEKIPIKFQ